MAYEFSWEERGFCHRHWGVVHPRDLAEILEIFYGDPRCDECRYVIADYSDAEDHAFEQTDITVVAGHDIGASKTIPRLRQALVATNPRFREACEHYVSIIRRSHITWETVIFDDVNEAYRWALGILENVTD